MKTAFCLRTASISIDHWPHLQSGRNSLLRSFWLFSAGTISPGAQSAISICCFMPSHSPLSWWEFTGFVQIEITVNLLVLDQTELRSFPSEDLDFPSICDSSWEIDKNYHSNRPRSVSDTQLNWFEKTLFDVIVSSSKGIEAMYDETHLLWIMENAMQKTRRHDPRHYNGCEWHGG